MPKVVSKVIQVRTASARVQWFQKGVAEVVYAGVLTRNDFEQLRAEVLAATCAAQSLILRMDETINALGRAVLQVVYEYPADTPPAAVVCRADDYDLWTEYGKAVADKGVMRAVFLSDHLELARVWALRHALVRL